MSFLASGLYSGHVRHTRHRPRRHAFRYRVFMAFFDLDELDGLSRHLRLFSRNRPNLVSFYDADHLAPGRPLRAQVESHLAEAGIAAGGAIRLLCMPRIFGYAFNPLSVFFCHRTDGRLAAILYEVNNTFGQRHSYLLPVTSDQDASGIVRQTCAKTFYVSPFMDMGLDYRFTIEGPGTTTHVGIDAFAGTSPMITTAFDGVRGEMTDRALLAAVVRHPLLTFKVVAGIHWEALFIWLKGIKLRPRPPAPSASITTPSRDAA
jgi:DUF1365 family protein